MVHDNPETSHSVPTHGPQAAASKYVQLGLLSVLVTLVVVLVVVLLTPPANQQLPVAEQESGEQAEPEPSLPAATVRLATEPREVTNEQLQAELLQEIELLCVQFGELPQALHVAASAYEKIHQTAEAERLWRRCIELEPRYPGPRLGLAMLMSDGGEDRRAIDLLEAALEEGVTTAELYYRLAQAHSKVGEVERAEQVLLAGVAVFPQVAINWLLLGQTQNLLQKFAAAEASLQRSIELGIADPAVYFALANSCQRQGKTDEAHEYRQKFTELKQQQASGSETKPFQEIYQQALRPVVVGTFSTGAAVYSKHGETDKAEKLLLRANALEPQNPSVLEELVLLYRVMSRPGDAQVVQRQLVTMDPQSTSYRVNLASILSQLGNWTAAIAELEEARRLSPNSPLPVLGLAQAFLQAKDLPRARRCAQEALQLAPSAEGYALLALICEQQGDREAATTAQQAALRMAPRGR